MTRLLAIVSGKGGAGKTTLAVNLGVAFSSLNRDTVVVDTDLTTPNVSLHIGTSNYNATLHDVLLGNAKIGDAVYFHHPSGLKFIPGHIALYRATQVSSNLLTNLRELLDGVAPLAILDSASGVEASTRLCINASNEVIGITTAHLPSVLDTLKTLNIARKCGSFVRGVVVNRLIGSRYEMSLSDIESLLEAKVIGAIPEDPAMVAALRLSHPIVSSYPNSSSAKAFKKLADSLIN